MGLKDDATRVTVLRALRDAVDAEYETARREVLDGLRSARADLGLKSIRVELPDGSPVAVITLVEPRAAVTVTDEPAFTKWVEQNHPGEVETLTRVRPAWRERFLASLDPGETPGPVADPQTGEVVPGLAARKPAEPRSFSLRPVPGGREQVARAWRSGALDLREVLALGPGWPADGEAGRAEGYEQQSA